MCNWPHFSHLLTYYLVGCRYCVPIPGVTTWAKSMHDVMDIKVPVEPSFAGGTSIPRKKRGARDFDKDDMDTSEESAPSCAASEKRVKATDLHSNEVHNAPSDAAASAAEPLASSSVGGSFDMNFPLPNEVGPAVMVKIYGQEAPKITQLVEITGIYEIDPTIGVHDFTSDDDFGDMADELRVHNPPASIIPRVHCVSIMPLAHANPVVPGMQAVTRESNAMTATFYYHEICHFGCKLSIYFFVAVKFLSVYDPRYNLM